MRSLVRMTVVMAGAVAAAEALDRWPRRGPSPARGAPVAIVVLGFPGHTAAGRAVQRWRVRMGVRAVERHPGAQLILSGGVTFGTASESAQMAMMARQAGVPDDAIVLEARSTTTWENVAFSRILSEGTEAVVLVSDGLHAARARSYWLRQFPADAGRVIVDPGYRAFEATWIKLASAAAQPARPLISRRLARRAR